MRSQVAISALPTASAGGLWPIESTEYRDVPSTARRYAPLVRDAAARGISAVLDGSGRVLARASSATGPVVLVVDAPIAAPR